MFGVPREGREGYLLQMRRRLMSEIFSALERTMPSFVWSLGDLWRVGHGGLWP